MRATSREEAASAGAAGVFGVVVVVAVVVGRGGAAAAAAASVASFLLASALPFASPFVPPLPASISLPIIEVSIAAAVGLEIVMEEKREPIEEELRGWPQQQMLLRRSRAATAGRIAAREGCARLM